MQLTDSSGNNLRAALVSSSLLGKTAIDVVIASLEGEKPVNWNLILTQEFEIENGGRREAES